MRALLAGALLLALGGCGERELPALEGAYQENGVTVALAVRDHRLSATFTPRTGFHLYSAALPEGGVDGLGFPTVLAAGAGLRATGPVVADRAVTLLRPAGLGVELPVYPDGPVTLILPVEAGDGKPATAIIGYAACSATRCLMPVTDQSVPLTTTASTGTQR